MIDGDGEEYLGDYVRRQMGVPTVRADAAVVERGSSLVPLFIGNQIIDLVREKARIIQAGAVTIPIQGPTNLCKILTDPTVIEHTEGADDITESFPTFGPVSLDPKTMAARIPLSLEVVQDSPNLDAALRTSIAGAFAGKLDALTVAVILADTGIPDSASGENCATSGWAPRGHRVGAGTRPGHPEGAYQRSGRLHRPGRGNGGREWELPRRSRSSAKHDRPPDQRDERRCRSFRGFFEGRRDRRQVGTHAGTPPVRQAGLRIARADGVREDGRVRAATGGAVHPEDDGRWRVTVVFTAWAAVLRGRLSSRPSDLDGVFPWEFSPISAIGNVYPARGAREGGVFRIGERRRSS